ncbi:MAG: primosomal replication protein PriC, partial [Pseudoalteromonas prydzensis]
MRTASFDKLCQQVATLKQHAEQFDKAKLFAKNRYMQAQPSLFDRGVFTTKSMKLVDYVLEIEDEVNSLPPLERRHAHNYALERIGNQVQAVFNVIKSTPIWEKENKSTYKARSKTFNKSAPYQQAVKQ